MQDHPWHHICVCVTYNRSQRSQLDLSNPKKVTLKVLGLPAIKLDSTSVLLHNIENYVRMSHTWFFLNLNMTQIWYFTAINQSIIDSLSVPSFETYMPNSDRVVDKYLRRLPPENTLVAQLDLSDLWKWPSRRFNKIHILQEIGTCTRNRFDKKKEKKVMRHFLRNKAWRRTNRN